MLVFQTDTADVSALLFIKSFRLESSVKKVMYQDSRLSWYITFVFRDIYLFFGTDVSKINGLVVHHFFKTIFSRLKSSMEVNNGIS